MAFPTSLTNAQDNVTSIVADHLNNVEAKIGIDSSAVTSSLDYILKNSASINPGHKHSNLWASDGSPEAITVDASGYVGIGVSPAYKLDLRDGSFSLSDADVSHTMTDYVAANTYGLLYPISGTAGGLAFHGLSDTDATALALYGSIGSEDPTDTTSAVIIQGAKRTSGTAIQALGASETVFQVYNYTTNVMSILGSGFTGIKQAVPTGLMHVNIGSTDNMAVICDTANSNQWNLLGFYRNGTARWKIGKDNANETGGDAGSNFSIIAYSDAGAYINTPLSLERASGTLSLPVGKINISNLPTSGTNIGDVYHSSGTLMIKLT
jgi:hypothetical protein